MASTVKNHEYKTLLGQRILGLNKNKSYVAKGTMTEKDILSLLNRVDPANNHARTEIVFNHSEDGVGGMNPAVKLTLELSKRERVFLKNMMAGQASLMPGAEPWVIDKNDKTGGGTLTVRTYGIDNPKSNVLTAHEAKAKYAVAFTVVRYIARSQTYKLDATVKPTDKIVPSISSEAFEKEGQFGKLALGERVEIPSSREVKLKVADMLTALDNASAKQEYNNHKNEPSRMRQQWEDVIGKEKLLSVRAELSTPSMDGDAHKARKIA